MSKLWNEGPSIGKGGNGASRGPRQQLNPPKGACYPSPRGLHPGPASPEKGPEEQPNPEAINTSAGVVPWPWNVSQNWGEWGWAGLGAALCPPESDPRIALSPIWDRIEAGPHLSVVKETPDPSPDQGPPTRLPSDSARTPEGTGRRSGSGLRRLHPTFHKPASPQE